MQVCKQWRTFRGHTHVGLDEYIHTQQHTAHMQGGMHTAWGAVRGLGPVRWPRSTLLLPQTPRKQGRLLQYVASCTIGHALTQCKQYTRRGRLPT
jgi:hypothetical protein